MSKRTRSISFHPKLLTDHTAMAIGGDQVAGPHAPLGSAGALPDQGTDALTLLLKADQLSAEAQLSPQFFRACAKNRLYKILAGNASLNGADLTSGRILSDPTKFFASQAFGLQDSAVAITRRFCLANGGLYAHRAEELHSA